MAVEKHSYNKFEALALQLANVPAEEFRKQILEWSKNFNIPNINNPTTIEQVTSEEEVLEKNHASLELPQVVLGEFAIGGQKLFLVRNSGHVPGMNMLGHKDNSWFLEYFLSTEGNFSDATLSFRWDWDERLRDPTNTHRSVSKKIRSRGLGSKVLSLGEECLKFNRFNKAYAESCKPGSVAWFITKNYVFRDRNDISADLLREIEVNVGNYSQYFKAHKVIKLEKEL